MIKMIHEYEATTSRVTELSNRRTELDRTMDRFRAKGLHVPKLLTLDSEMNAAQLERASMKLETLRANVIAAVIEFDTTEYDARLSADITRLESEVRTLNNAFLPADKKVNLAKANGWAVPKDAIKIVETLAPQIATNCEALALLYALRDNRYELVKYFLMLDALKERGQQKDQEVGTSHIKFTGPERLSARNNNHDCQSRKAKKAARDRAIRIAMKGQGNGGRKKEQAA